MALVWSGNIRRFQKQFKQAQKWLDESVLRDAEPFVPKQTGTLQRSGEISPGGGTVQWTAPYAAAVYYRKKDRGSTQNPDARRLWFEAARARHGQNWARGVKKRAGGACWTRSKIWCPVR